MKVENIQTYQSMPREEYIKLPGISFSGLKSKPIPNSFGVKIGSLVHKYILTPKEYNYEYPEIVIPIASELINYCSIDVIRGMQAEFPITADFIFSSFSFNWKGIPDLGLRKVLAIDFKVLSGSLLVAIDRYNYKEQLRGYMLGLEAPLGLIISYNKVTKRVERYFVTPDSKWWSNIVLTRGNILV